jgi:trimeric autotransporter adhesin
MPRILARTHGPDLAVTERLLTAPPAARLLARRSFISTGDMIFPKLSFMKIRTQSILILLSVLCFGLLPVAQAVVPPPDGGYPNFTTAEGQKALFSLTTGAANTAVGWSALLTDAAGSFNTATGAGALLFNTADDNTAFGAAALLFNTTGPDNTAVGVAALLHNTTGADNTATGASALVLNTEGSFNTASGSEALFSNTTGSNNTAVGRSALGNNTTGSPNTAIGSEALASNTTGQFNTATGASALSTNTTGDNNTATGSFTLFDATGEANTATGFLALRFTTTGSSNTATGVSALQNNTTGSFNTALGFNAGENQTTGSNNVYIGAGLVGVAGESNVCYIASIFGQTSGGGAPVFINATGKLGTTTSSRRFKEDIQLMDRTSEALFSLKPVSFRYKKEIDPAGTSQFGLVAEDVERVNPDLIVRDKEGNPYSVRYDQVNAMLLNEFLKEHSTVQEMKSTLAKQEALMTEHRKDFEFKLAQQQKQIEALTAGLQKVSTQLATASPSGGGLEASKAVVQTARNDQ